MEVPAPNRRRENERLIPLAVNWSATRRLPWGCLCQARPSKAESEHLSSFSWSVCKLSAIPTSAHSIPQPVLGTKAIPVHTEPGLPGAAAEIAEFFNAACHPPPIADAARSYLFAEGACRKLVEGNYGTQESRYLQKGR